MNRRRVTLTTVLLAAATTGAFAFQKSLEPANQPGHPAPANVWVQNRDPDEAIPVRFIGHTAIGIEPGALVNTHVAPQPWAYRTVAVKTDAELADALHGAGRRWLGGRWPRRGDGRSRHRTLEAAAVGARNRAVACSTFTHSSNSRLRRGVVC